MNELIKKVEAWGEEKGIVDPSNADKQFAKFKEDVIWIEAMLDVEVTNYASYGDYVLCDKTKVKFGDALVTLVILAKQLGMDLEECLSTAYKKNKDSKGKIIDGVFIREEDLEVRGAVMKVFVVIDGEETGKESIVGVFESLERANAAFADYILSTKVGTKYSCCVDIAEFEVEK
ncbi:hypothetical protein AAA081_00380 [Aedoeadaptatus acetigenes]|uniref:DUF7336 domain-containing protein n=1 Tax=Aedoeadaptatus acetigenes TaxID=2981723 RepID=A0ABV1J3K2_9FIRM